MFLLLFVVHNCRNKEMNVSYVTKPFCKHYLICNPKFCINQEIKVNEGDFSIFFLVILCQSHLSDLTYIFFKVSFSYFDSKL